MNFVIVKFILENFVEASQDAFRHSSYLFRNFCILLKIPLGIHIGNDSYSSGMIMIQFVLFISCHREACQSCTFCIRERVDIKVIWISLQVKL